MQQVLARFPFSSVDLRNQAPKVYLHGPIKQSDFFAIMRKKAYKAHRVAASYCTQRNREWSFKPLAIIEPHQKGSFIIQAIL
jgi:hypothetical protein